MPSAQILPRRKEDPSNTAETDPDVDFTDVATSMVAAKAVTKMQAAFRGRASRAKNGFAASNTKWDLRLWLQSCNLHHPAADMMEPALNKLGKHSEDDARAYLLKGLVNSSELAKLFDKDALFEQTLKLLWDYLSNLAGEQRSSLGGAPSKVDIEAAAGAAAAVGDSAESVETEDDVVQSKFASIGPSFTLKYGGLSSFFGGLEKEIGSPDPKIWEAMEHEHNDQETDALYEFTTGNYGITTTHPLEWLFVTDADHPPEAGWPVEMKLAGNPECAWQMRKPMPRANLESERERVNKQLYKLSAPGLIFEELVGGRLYTGPMFVKYNECAIWLKRALHHQSTRTPSSTRQPQH